MSNRRKSAWQRWIQSRNATPKSPSAPQRDKTGEWRRGGGDANYPYGPSKHHARRGLNALYRSLERRK